jgi:RND family efflux transporter MFP subunit
LARSRTGPSSFAGARRGLSVGCLLLCACLGCRRAEPPAAEKAPPATVVWKTASLNALEEWTELVGTTVPVPDHSARVSAAVEGRVISVLGESNGKPLAEGQRVEKGTVLAQLDPSITQANLAKAEADRDVLREEEHQAQLALELANSESNRLRKLKEEEDARPAGSRTPLVSPVDVYKAGMALKDAESKLRGAQAKLAAGVKAEDALRAQLKLLTLTAPIGGRLGRLQVVPGQSLSVGATVADIVDLDEQIDVLCFVPPGVVRRLQLGQQAMSGPIEKDPADNTSDAAGQVEYIAEQAEPETGNFAVKVRFANKDARLRANRVLRIRILTQPGRECLSLPEAAVSEDQEVPTVVIVEGIKTEKNDEGKEETTGVARRLQVTLGVRDRILHQIEILGLEDPDREAKVKWQGDPREQQYVVEGGLGLQTGDKVKLDAGDD